MKVLNCKTDFISKDAVYIGRGSKYGNPYRIGIDGNRDFVCDMFEKNVLPNLNIDELYDKDLVCFCAPKRCHGHSIVNKLLSIERFFG